MLVEGLDDLHRLIDFGSNPLFKQQFRAVQQMIQIALDVGGFAFQQFAVITQESLLHRLQVALKQADVLPDKIASQGQRQRENQRQRTHQLQTGQPSFSVHPDKMALRGQTLTAVYACWKTLILVQEHTGQTHHDVVTPTEPGRVPNARLSRHPLRAPRHA